MNQSITWFDRRRSWMATRRRWSAFAAMVLFYSAIPAFGESNQDPPDKPRWLVVVEDSTVDPGTNRAGHRYRLKIFKAADKQQRLLLDHSLPGDRTKEVASIVVGIAKVGLPPDESQPAARAGESDIFVVLRQRTNNRRREVWFALHDAERLGLQGAIDRLAKIVKESIALKGNDLELREFQSKLAANKT